MGTLDTAVDPRAPSYLDNRATMLSALSALESALDAAREGGGERAITRHHARGKLLARERIELLVDRDSPLLELSPVAGWGSDCPVGAGVVAALGVVEDRICVIVANDPTVRGGALNAYGLRKLQRAGEIARQNRLPLISLLEPGGVEPADQRDLYLRGGQLMAGLARMAAAWIPTVGVFFAPPDTGLAAPGASFDYVVMLRDHAAGRNGRAGQPAPDHLAEDERDALRLTRQCARRFPMSAPATPSVPQPRHDPEDLLALPATEPREVLARVLDDSEFDEVQPTYGSGLCAGWGYLHGHPVAVVADTAQAASEPEVRKADRFIRRAEMAGVPLIFLRHASAALASTEAAVAGAVADAGLPVISIRTGDWWGMPAADLDARFRFAWPTAQGALDPAHDGRGASPLHLSGQLHDDGVIDPRDTRTVLGFCLAAVTGAPS